MALVYRIKVIDALKAQGYSTYRLRKEGLFSESALQRLRNNEPLSWSNLETLCKLLNVQPNEIIRYIPDEEQ